MFKALLFLPGLLFAAPEWSVWRGPAGNGDYSHETSWKHDWASSGAPVAWTAKVHLGYSGVAVSEGRVYTLGNSEGEDLIQCLDLNTGKAIWSEGYPQDLIPKYNPGGPNAPPMIDGKWLYVLSKQGLVSCLDKASGKARWRNDLATTAKAPMPTWGFASCPVLLGDRLFLNVNESGVALDRKTGKILWTSPPSSCGYAAVVPLTSHKQAALAVFGHKAMHVVNQATGKVLWKVAWPTKYGENSADPLVLGDKLYLSSWWGQGAALFDPNRNSSTPIWTNKEFQNHIQPPVVFEGHLYGFDGPVHKKNKQGHLRCVEIATGKTIWSRPDLKGSLILSQGKLLILTQDGSVIIAKAHPSGYQELARQSGFGKRTWSPPVLHQGRLFIRDADGTLTCLDLR